jgi:hypothetical protein
MHNQENPRFPRHVLESCEVVAKRRLDMKCLQAGLNTNFRRGDGNYVF